MQVPTAQMHPYVRSRVKGYGQSRTIRRKGRKRWTHRHKAVLEACFIVFGQDFEKVRFFLPEFTSAFLRNKISHYEWINCINSVATDQN